jgi:hypothetical protein
MEQTIGAYFAMIQAERDAEAGRAVEDEPIDKLIAAFDAWVPAFRRLAGRAATGASSARAHLMVCHVTDSHRRGCGEGDGGSARKTWYRQSHDDACRHESPMAGRPQRDAVGGDAGRIMDPHGRRRRQLRHAAAAKRGASERARVGNQDWLGAKSWLAESA